MLARYLATILFLSTFSQLTQAGINFESTANTAELLKVQNLAAEIFRHPTKMSEKLHAQISDLPDYGWQPAWSVELKALDLVGYYFALEKEQYYASAGKWKAPKHLYKDSHLEFYEKVINPEAGVYSSGLSHSTIYVFGEQFLKGLMARGSDRDLDLIIILAQTGREFWRKMILWHVFTHPEATTKYVTDLIFALDLEPDNQGAVDVTDIVEAIFKRQANRTTNDSEKLLKAMYGWIHLYFEGKRAEMYPGYSQVLLEESCAALITSVDEAHSAISGRSIIKK